MIHNSICGMILIGCFHNYIFLSVNELLPILRVFKRFNPSILNVFTEQKHPSPISIDRNHLYIFRSKTSRSLQHPTGTVKLVTCRIMFVKSISLCTTNYWGIQSYLPKYRSTPLTSSPSFHSHSRVAIPVSSSIRHPFPSRINRSLSSS